VSEQTPQPEAQQQEQKPERVDELDVIGGMIVRLIQKIFGSFKKRPNSQQ